MPTTIASWPRSRRCLRQAPDGRYCNGCYIVLGAIIAKVTGMPYEDYIAAHVYTPAGMTTAGPTGQASGRGVHAAGAAVVTAAAQQREHARRVRKRCRRRIRHRPRPAELRRRVARRSAGRSRQTAWLLDVAEATPGRSEGGLGIAGGAPGLNGILESSKAWTVVVLANLDPPAAQQLGVAIHKQLSR